MLQKGLEIAVLLVLMEDRIAKGINEGRINFFDKHLSMFPVDLLYGYYTKHKENNRLDVAIVEASAITEDGGIIPGASVGASPEIIQMVREQHQNSAFGD